MSGEMSEKQGWHDHEIKIENVLNPDRAWWQFWKPEQINLLLTLKIRAPKDTPVYIAQVMVQKVDND